MQRVLTKNPTYWDIDNVFIDTIQFTYNAEASTLGSTMYLSGEVDYAEIGANLLSPMLSSYSDQIHPSRPDVSYSYWYLFNFDPGFDEEYEPDNWKIAVNNENFRLSIMHGLDRVNAMQVYDSANPEGLLNNTITPLSFASASKDYAYYGGLDKYTDGETFDADLALEYKEKAVAELTEAWMALVRAWGTSIRRGGRIIREQRVRAMLSYVRQHLTEPMRLEEMSAAAGISPRECTRCFRDVLGISAVEHVTLLRVRAAARMLEEGSVLPFHL